jgi:hypothetical protein
MDCRQVYIIIIIIIIIALLDNTGMASNDTSVHTNFC